jgi:hypothetical protein
MFLTSFQVEGSENSSDKITADVLTAEIEKSAGNFEHVECSRRALVKQ